MQENGLHKLGKTELLTIIYEQEKQIEQLKNDVKDLNKQLEDRTIQIQEAGSIADASLKINKIFEAAQQAADEYLRSIKEVNKVSQENAEIQKDITNDKVSEETIEQEKIQNTDEILENNVEEKIDIEKIQDFEEIFDDDILENTVEETVQKTNEILENNIEKTKKDLMALVLINRELVKIKLFKRIAIYFNHLKEKIKILATNIQTNFISKKENLQKVFKQKRLKILESKEKKKKESEERKIQKAKEKEEKKKELEERKLKKAKEKEEKQKEKLKKEELKKEELKKEEKKSKLEESKNEKPKQNEEKKELEKAKKSSNKDSKTQSNVKSNGKNKENQKKEKDNKKNAENSQNKNIILEKYDKIFSKIKEKFSNINKKVIDKKDKFLVKYNSKKTEIKKFFVEKKDKIKEQFKKTVEKVKSKLNEIKKKIIKKEKTNKKDTKKNISHKKDEEKKSNKKENKSKTNKIEAKKSESNEKNKSKKSIKEFFTSIFTKKEKFDVKNIKISLQDLEKELKRRKENASKARFARTLTFSGVVIVAFTIIVATRVFNVLQVSGNSMEPSLYSGDLLISSKILGYEKGDMIAFYYSNSVLIKRIIATEGDIVYIDDEGNVFVNSKKIEEDYVEKLSYGKCDITFPYKVPDKEVFVLGDNRETSIDSRSKALGSIAEDKILGKITINIKKLMFY